MRINFFWLFLLALWIETSYGELRSLEKNKMEHHERVLIRTKRRWVLSTIELEEEDPGPFPKEATQLFNDKGTDHRLRFSISGQGVDKEPLGVFSIQPLTGIVVVHKPIDREQYPFFQVEFNVADRDTNVILDRTLSFNVAIKDKNDNPPQFMPVVLRSTIPEKMTQGVLPMSLQAKDIDEKGTDNSRITITLLSQQPASPVFSINQIPQNTDDYVVAQLLFNGCFDYDKVKSYTLLVKAEDRGNPVLSSTGTVIIDISDSNTHLPVFTSAKYNTQVMEMESNKEILRLKVEDLDTPNTPASRAVYRILKGNEDGNYKIETDPITNEGILTVIKGKDFERTTLTELEIGVVNEEPLFLCINGKPATPEMLKAAKFNTTKVAVKVIDVNDPPVFEKKIETVYRKEELNPGDVLYEPVVKDVDSALDKLRYEIVEDPAKWVTIDNKTGKVTSVKKMDRESPFVKNGTYTVLIRAIDNGEPPATGTGTLIIHLGDLNDNKPYLTSNTSVMCGNKADRMTVKASDADAPPFGGPFSFSVGSEDKELLSTWKFNPSTGPETSLIALKPLPYGNYSVPLRIEDQQGLVGEEVLNVVVCDCGKEDVCRNLLPRTSNLHGAAIGILLGSMLLFALLLCCCFFCERKTKQFTYNLQEEGNQTLINYNEEGGGSLAKAEPQFFQSTNINHLGGTMPSGNIQLAEFSNGYKGMNGTMKMYASREMLSGGFQQMADTGGTMRTHSWGTARSGTYRSGTNRFSRTYSLTSDWNIEDHLHRKLHELPEDQLDFPKYQPREYNYEGTGSKCPSMDELSFSGNEDDLDFVNHLGPKFHTLDEIWRKAMKEKNIQL